MMISLRRCVSGCPFFYGVKHKKEVRGMTDISLSNAASCTGERRGSGRNTGSNAQGQGAWKRNSRGTQGACVCWIYTQEPTADHVRAHRQGVGGRCAYKRRAGTRTGNYSGRRYGEKRACDLHVMSFDDGDDDDDDDNDTTRFGL